MGAVGKGKLFWFFTVWLCVGKNQMCLTVRLVFYTDAQRFGYCRRREFLAQKFNRRTNIEPCANVKWKPFSPAFGNTLLCGVFYLFLFHSSLSIFLLISHSSNDVRI